MKYAVIITYTSGERTGATVVANTQQEAWQKLLAAIPCNHIQAIEIAELLTAEREII